LRGKLSNRSDKAIFKRCEGCFEHRPAGQNDKVETLQKSTLVPAESFPDYSLRPVSEYGTTKSSGSDDPKFGSVDRLTGFHQLHPEKMILEPLAILLNEAKLIGLPQS
jgi:hypothetical protein